MADPTVISCTQAHLTANDLFKLSVRTTTGEELTCSQSFLNVLDLFRSCVRVNDDGTFSIAITFDGDTINLGDYWRFTVDATTHDLLLQRYKGGAWQTVESNIY